MRRQWRRRQPAVVGWRLKPAAVEKGGRRDARRERGGETEKGERRDKGSGSNPGAGTEQAQPGLATTNPVNDDGDAYESVAVAPTNRTKANAAGHTACPKYWACCYLSNKKPEPLLDNQANLNLE
uniref:Uncharacterized protein n=1 Tax=Oryza glumipatula TaxID=40148 RepID=A0A0E0BGU4_9ORYZ